MTPADTSTEAAEHDQTKPTEAKQTNAILIAVLLVLIAWGVAVAIWGLPGLYIPAIGLVPVVFGGLLLLTMGK